MSCRVVSLCRGYVAAKDKLTEDVEAEALEGVAVQEAHDIPGVERGACGTDREHDLSVVHLAVDLEGWGCTGGRETERDDKTVKKREVARTAWVLYERMCEERAAGSSGAVPRGKTRTTHDGK